MRKLLLATTAMMAFAGAAQAAESPIQVTLGGSVDFRAALMNESSKDFTTTSKARRGDFETLYEITIAAEGKAANGIEYGALINLDNDQSRDAQEATMDMAYLWIQGAYGKVVMGDHHGAMNLAVYAPIVGAGQIDGAYDDFTSPGALANIDPYMQSDAEDRTKVTYYTPKFGSEDHKVQVGVSFQPNRSQGSTVTRYEGTTNYKNTIETAAKYTGKLGEVSVAVTPVMIIADGMGATNAATSTRDFTMWGVGSQVAYADFTLGASYANNGRANTAQGEDRNQDTWTFGLKYEGIKDVELAASYLTGEGYYTVAGLSAGRQYIDSYDMLGLGATYTWFPGMRTAADAVFYNQNRADTGRNNIGHVLLLSQKMSF